MTSVARLTRLADAIWRRHANPWSVGTRLLTTPHGWKRRLAASVLTVVLCNAGFLDRMARSRR